MSEKKDFVEGLFLKRRENAPSFVLFSAGVNVEKFTKWLNENKDHKGYVNIDFLNSKDNKPYAKKNEFKPQQQTEPKQTINIPSNDNTGNSDNLPF